jgi:hypothetical protein
MKLLVMQLSPPSRQSIPLWSKYSLQHPVLVTIQNDGEVQNPNNSVSNISIVLKDIAKYRERPEFALNAVTQSLSVPATTLSDLYATAFAYKKLATAGC